MITHRRIENGFDLNKYKINIVQIIYKRFKFKISIFAYTN